MLNQRKVALDAIIAVNENYGYSNLVLQKALDNPEINSQNKPFITALFYGVLDRVITLDYIISRFVKKPVKSIKPVTLNALRLAIFQIMYLDKVPDSAAVDESVELVKNSKEKYNAAFVNAVLRNFLRQGVNIPNDNSVYSLSIKYSCPEWIIDSFIEDYGIDETLRILNHYLTAPDITVRINTSKINDADFIKRLNSSGVNAVISDIAHSAVFDEGVDIKSLSEYGEGLFFAEDLPSQIAVSKLDIADGNRLLDMCAAPGGKSFLSALYGGGNSQIVSCDYLENRVSLIRNGAQRLGLGNIICKVCDAKTYYPELGLFDRIICDVPCSGLGVIRRKPEIKYRKDTDFKELEITQKSILQNSVKYLKPGGKIMYSTCTLRCNENENIVREFLDKYTDFELECEHTFLPGKDKTDGFYYAIISGR